MKLRWPGHGPTFLLPFITTQQRGNTNTLRKARAASIGSCLSEPLNVYLPVAGQFASIDDKRYSPDPANAVQHLHRGNKSKVCCLNPFMMVTG